MDDFSVISFGGTNYKFSKQGILFFPYYGYSGYGNFGLIDCVNKNTIDLEPLKHLFESNTPIDFDLFDIENQFIKYKDKMVQFDRLKNSDNNKVRTIFRKEFLVIGQWNLGFAINEHTISSTLNEDGSFDTMRTELGELLYQYKYCFNRDKEDNISKIVTENLFKLFPSIDFIIPIPASNFNRPFQPVIELVKKISELSKIPIELGYLEKIPTPAIKEINDTKQREKILKNAFSVPDRRCKGKTVLLFDDFYRSGATLNAATKALKEQGDVETVYVLTITKTRTKR
jgi:predicted amidophosphoribosyltransferase